MTPLFNPQVETIISVIAGALITTAQFVLIRDTWTGKIKPSVLSWLGWGLMIGVGCIAQFIETGWEQSLTGLAVSTIGCFAIAFIALLRKNYAIERVDYVYLSLGIVCLIIYTSSRDPWITTILAIISDFIVGVPMLIAAWKLPASQKSHGWIIGGISWTCTLLICLGHPVLYAIFPIYLFAYNWTMVVLGNRK